MIGIFLPVALNLYFSMQLLIKRTVYLNSIIEGSQFGKLKNKFSAVAN